MFRLTSLASAIMLFAVLDVPWVYPLRPQALQPGPTELPSLISPPDVFLEVGQGSTGKDPIDAPKSRLSLIRYVDGEYAHVVKPLPLDKHGFRYKVGQPIDEKALHRALLSGSAANPGDQVQITELDFKDKEIVVSINGGTKQHFNWRQHIQISAPIMASAQTNDRPNARPGAELILDFGKPLPELSPVELKEALAPFLDFSGERSAAVNWVDTLPPQFQNAIKTHKAIVGMNHEMVIAALGRPDQKFRETDPEGKQTEDWIYGHPPSPTVIVTFANDDVIRVKNYN
jgi:hypothetical protein